MQRGPSVIFVTHWILRDAEAKLFVSQCPRVRARTPTAMKAEIQFFAGYLTLAFHEARNVRHLGERQASGDIAFRMLIDGLSGESDPSVESPSAVSPKSV